jgi:hypothetical protein
MNEVLHSIDDEFCTVIEEERGFLAYQVLNIGDGTLITISTFRNRQGADESAGLAAAWVRDELAHVNIERLDAWTGEVRVGRAISEVLQPSHA